MAKKNKLGDEEVDGVLKKVMHDMHDKIDHVIHPSHKGPVDQNKKESDLMKHSKFDKFKQGVN